jgi:hypothetical protein
VKAIGEWRPFRTWRRIGNAQRRAEEEGGRVRYLCPEWNEEVVLDRGPNTRRPRPWRRRPRWISTFRLVGTGLPPSRWTGRRTLPIREEVLPDGLGRDVTRSPSCEEYNSCVLTNR